MNPEDPNFKNLNQDTKPEPAQPVGLQQQPEANTPDAQDPNKLAVQPGATGPGAASKKKLIAVLVGASIIVLGVIGFVIYTIFSEPENEVFENEAAVQRQNSSDNEADSEDEPVPTSVTTDCYSFDAPPEWASAVVDQGVCAIIIESKPSLSVRIHTEEGFTYDDLDDFVNSNFFGDETQQDINLDGIPAKKIVDTVFGDQIFVFVKDKGYKTSRGHTIEGFEISVGDIITPTEQEAQQRQENIDKLESTWKWQ